MPETVADPITAAITSSLDSAREAGTIEPAADDTPSEAPAADAAVTESVASPAAEPVPPAPAETPEAKGEADELAAITKELLDKTPGLAKGRIRVVDHQAVLTRTRRAHEKDVAELRAQIEKVKHLDSPDTTESLQAMRLAETKPDVFVKQVLLNDSRYVEVFNAMVEEAIAKRGGAAPAARTAGVTDVPAERPKPDSLQADGTLGYSAEALEQILAIERAEARKASEADLAKLREELKPVTSRAEAETKITQALERQGKVLEDARANWDEFTTHEAEIRAELAKPGNERMGLDTAYRKVVFGKLKAGATLSESEKARIRAEERVAYAKELNAAPRTGNLRPGALPAATGGDPNVAAPLEEVIRSSMRAAGM
jgi:hypothetical protein